MALQLFDLAGAEDDRRFSPYCWRTRMALAHKSLEVDTIPWRFTDKEAIANSGQTRVPVLVDGERWIADSWKIACYLEDTYPDRPSLFGGPSGRALSRFHSAYADALVSSIFRFVAHDILQHVHEKDREYYRTSREARIGTTLESFVASRDERLSAFRASLMPLRQTLDVQPFLAGEQPAYADYAVFGPFQWARCISAYPLLATDDPVRAWLDRLLDAFGGLARAAPGYDAR